MRLWIKAPPTSIPAFPAALATTALLLPPSPLALVADTPDTIAVAAPNTESEVPMTPKFLLLVSSSFSVIFDRRISISGLYAEMASILSFYKKFLIT